MLESVGVEFNLKYSDGHFFCDVKCDCYCDCHVALANFIIFLLLFVMEDGFHISFWIMSCIKLNVDRYEDT